MEGCNLEKIVLRPKEVGKNDTVVSLFSKFVAEFITGDDITHKFLDDLLIILMIMIILCLVFYSKLFSSPLKNDYLIIKTINSSMQIKRNGDKWAIFIFQLSCGSYKLNLQMSLKNDHTVKISYSQISSLYQHLEINSY